MQLAFASTAALMQLFGLLQDWPGADAWHEPGKRPGVVVRGGPVALGGRDLLRVGVGVVPPRPGGNLKTTREVQIGFPKFNPEIQNENSDKSSKLITSEVILSLP